MLEIQLLQQELEKEKKVKPQEVKQLTNFNEEIKQYEPKDFEVCFILRR